MIDAELAFKSVARRFLAGQLQHQRMDAQFDSLDVLRLQAMRLRNLYATVDARMNDDAAGERLVRVVRDFEILSQAIGDRVPFPLRRIRLQEPARRLERATRCRVAMARKKRGHQAHPRRGAGMQRLGHRPELLAHAGRLRRRDADCHRRLLDIQAQQARASRRGTEHAGRAGDVPAAIVMRRIDCVADAARDIRAEDDRVDELPAGCA